MKALLSITQNVVRIVLLVLTKVSLSFSTMVKNTAMSGRKVSGLVMISIN